MKRLLLILCISLSALCASAEEINAFVLHLVSGSNITFMLDERPVVTFEGEELVITTHMNTIRYQATDVIRFTYTVADPASIDIVSTGVSSFSFDGDVLLANNLVPETIVSVYTVNGILVSSGNTDKKGSVSLSLPGQAGMVYIVKTSVANFKITKP